MLPGWKHHVKTYIYITAAAIQISNGGLHHGEHHQLKYNPSPIILGVRRKCTKYFFYGILNGKESVAWWNNGKGVVRSSNPSAFGGIIMIRI